MSAFISRIPKFHRLKLISKKLEYENCYSYIFEKGSVNFEAGQYGHILSRWIPSKKFVREMSFSSHPNDTNLQITMHHDPLSPFKNEMWALAVGDSISVFKIKGKFILPNEPQSPMVFCAGGVGMTPFRPMALEAHRKGGYNITLFQVQRNGKFLFSDDLQNIVSTYVQSHPDDLESKLGALATEMKNAIFFVCGSQRFVNGALNVLKARGIPNNQIRLESFNKVKKT